MKLIRSGCSGFPRIALRTLRSPIYLLVVLGQVNLAALLSGLATFMAKFIEKQFSQTISFSNMMIGETGSVSKPPACYDPALTGPPCFRRSRDPAGGPGNRSGRSSDAQVQHVGHRCQQAVLWSHPPLLFLRPANALCWVLHPDGGWRLSFQVVRNRLGRGLAETYELMIVLEFSSENLKADTRTASTLFLYSGFEQI